MMYFYPVNLTGCRKCLSRHKTCKYCLYVKYEMLLFSVIHMLPIPVILADVAGLSGYPSKATMRGLQGRNTPLSWYAYFLVSSNDQPRNSLAGDFVTSHKA